MKVALITGGGSGIGRAVAQEFVQAGYSVLVTGRRETKLAETLVAVRECFPKAEIMSAPADIGEESAVVELFRKAKEVWGGVDTVINNAGAFVRAAAVEHSLADWNRILATNLTGPFLCARELFRQKQTSGRGESIVNIGSIAGIRGTDKLANASSYVTTKFGVVGLTEALAVEGAKLGVRVNCLAPGAVDTDMLQAAFPGYQAQTKPPQIAKLILFLADPERSGILQGSTLEVFCNS